MPSEQSEKILFLGYTNFRDDRLRFGIRKGDRRYHTYIIGQTGTGKSTLLKNLILQDIKNGEGVAVLDPHGDLVEQLVSFIPEERKADLIHFNVPDPNCQIGFNPLANIPSSRRSLVASELVETFKKIWGHTWGPRLEHILRNALLTLLDQPSATLSDIKRLFHEPQFLKAAYSNLTNPEVKHFWAKEFASWLPRFRAESVAPILNKVAAFLTAPNLRRVFVESKNIFDLRKVMDEGKILLVNLAKGKLGSDNSSLLGALLVSGIGLAAVSRADQPEANRREFYLYADEFQNFTTLSTANMLSELRKYRLSITLAHQYLDQLEPEIRDAILGNVGNIISFRVGVQDATLLEKIFFPEFSKEDLIALPNYSIYLRLMINGQPAKPFSADTELTRDSRSAVRPALDWLSRPLVILLAAAFRTIPPRLARRLPPPPEIWVTM